MRVAVASTPLTATLADAVPAVVAAIGAAAEAGAAIVCLPEAALPGHRSQPRPVPDVSAADMDRALAACAGACRRAGVAAVIGAERPTPAGREIVAVVVGADGRRLGVQAKTQIDPSEEGDYVAGSGRRTFETGGLRFAVAICHEAFRHPETVRTGVLAGARVVFVPHYVTTGGGRLPGRWCDPDSPYNEKALLCRAVENGVYVAQANVACPDQGSASCIVAPDGSLVAQVPYGRTGVAAADIDLALADGAPARRWSAERNALTELPG